MGRRPLIGGLILAVAWLLLVEPPPAAADEHVASAPDGGLQRLEELVVTGTRTPRPDLTSSSSMVQAQAENLATQGTVRVEDMFRTLPSCPRTRMLAGPMTPPARRR